jgi:hypothetical protein
MGIPRIRLRTARDTTAIMSAIWNAGKESVSSSAFQSIQSAESSEILERVEKLRNGPLPEYARNAVRCFLAHLYSCFRIECLESKMT